ncbi:hypothetical protein ABFU82_19970 [Nocardioides sp. WV_118_6]
MYEQESNDPAEPQPVSENHFHFDGDGVKWIVGGAVLIVSVFTAGLYGIARQPGGASKLEAIGTWFPWRKAKPSEPELPAEPPAEIE